MSTLAVITLTLVFTVLVFGLVAELIDNYHFRRQRKRLEEEQFLSSVKRVLKHEIKNIEKDKNVSG